MDGVTLRVRAGPCFEAAPIVFVARKKSDVTERLIRDEFLFFVVFDCQVIIRMPGARIEINLAFGLGRAVVCS